MPVLTTAEKASYDAIALNGVTVNELQNEDFTFNLAYDGNLGPTLSRAEIETVIADNGLPQPTNTVSFKIFDSSGNAFLVSYLQSVYAYVYVKLSLAT